MAVVRAFPWLPGRFSSGGAAPWLGSSKAIQNRPIRVIGGRVVEVSQPALHGCQCLHLWSGPLQTGYPVEPGVVLM